MVRAGRMPFLEAGAEPVLRQVIGKIAGRRQRPDARLAGRGIVVVVIGTPVDEHLNPTFHAMRRFFDELLPHLVDGQCLILRSTVYPGTTEKVRDAGAPRRAGDVHVAFCPERIAEGKAMEELAELPQIVSGCDERGRRDGRPSSSAGSPGRSSDSRRSRPS